MIDQIQKFFSSKLNPANEETDQEKMRLAAAALMVEVMVIDRDLNTAELTEIQHMLTKRFQLASVEIEQLVELARKEVDSATSLFQFTRLINDHFDAEAKTHLIENLWRVAFADQVLDKHEEALIRRIAELLYVSHMDFIQAKSALWAVKQSAYPPVSAILLKGMDKVDKFFLVAII